MKKPTIVPSADAPTAKVSEITPEARVVKALRDLMDELAVGLTEAKKIGVRTNFNYPDPSPDQPFRVEAKFWKEL